MKCSKCGSTIDSSMHVCPVCGNLFSAKETSEDIQNELGSKIEMILGESEDGFRGLDDGIEMREGHMEAGRSSKVSDTQEFRVPDTVFEQRSDEEIAAALKRNERAQQDIEDQYHWDSKRDWEDLDDEAMLEKLMKDEDHSDRSFAGQGVGKTTYRKTASEVSQSAPVRRTSERNTQDRPARRRKPRVREAKKAPGRSHAGLIIGLIAAVLAASAIGVILYTGVYKNWIFWDTDETERTTEADILTCNIQEGGTYPLPLNITVESSAGNRLYYTLDGSEPNNKSLKVSGPININGDYVSWTEAPYTLKVVSYTDTSIKAADLTVNFTVRKPDIAAPLFSLAAGTYVSAQGITISAEQGATIYYTYDEWGSMPTTESAVYRGTIEMQSGTKILSAIAVNGDRISEVAQVTYTLSLAINYSYDDAYMKIASKVTNEGYQVSETEPTVATTPETTTPPPETTKEGETTKETTAPATIPTEAPKVTTAVLFNSGTLEIEGVTYYCIWVQLYYNNGERADGMYYGVDSSSGAIVRLANNGGYYSIIK